MSRRPSASTSAPRSREGSSRGLQPAFENGRSVSITSKLEDDDDDTPRRSTRGRNPLPPVKGPLFPPLPPKQPKSSPKAISSPAQPSTPTFNPPGSSSLALAAAVAEEELNESEKVDLPSTSNASLTPPPPGSEDALMDADVSRVEDEESEDATGAPVHGVDSRDDLSQQATMAAHPDIKVEPTGQEDDEATPVKNKVENGVNVEGTVSGNATPTGSGERSKSARADSFSRQNRRRRGEEQLLLDDHLLPEELRKTGALAGKRGQKENEAQTHIEEAKQEVQEASEVFEEDEDENIDPVEDAEEEQDLTGEAEVGDEEQKDVTRCVCKQDDIDVMMIQCDQCNVWQHGPCVGIWEDEEAPDEYFCEECKPELHGPLKRWIRTCGRNPALYIPPTPLDLKKFHNPHDRYPPSQSKRWPPPAKMEPPPRAPRSHHKKELDSPIENVDTRRGERNRTASATLRAEKPASVGKDSKPRPPPILHRRKDSAGLLQSASPERSLSPSTATHPVKKRSTMNSRDSAYEDAVRAALEASRLEMGGQVEGQESVVEQKEDEEGEPEVEKEGEKEKEREKARKGKRKREEEELEPPDSTVLPPAGAKAKHPNQYTYRPKPLSVPQVQALQAPPAAAASPARRSANTPVPTLPPPQHDHGTRRAGAIVNGAIANPTLSAQSVASLHWFMPEHLSAYADVLPASQPRALQVRSALTYPPISRNHFHNQRYGPFSEARNSDSRLILPEEPPYRDPPGDRDTHLEPPARIRFPVRRMTVAEMRKRVRHMLEYVGKVQVEERKRAERAATIGIVVKPVKPNVRSPAPPPDGDDEHVADNIDPPEHDDMDAEEDHRTAAQLMDELTQDLLAFQETYAVNGFASPLPPPISTFETQHVPSMLSAATVTTMDLDGLPSASTETSGNADDSQTGPHVADEPMMPNGHAQQAAAGGEGMIETTIESMDVYREGEVHKVIVQEHEQEVADLVEKERMEVLEPGLASQSEVEPVAALA